MNIFDCANVTSVSNGTEWTGANHTHTDHVVRLLVADDSNQAHAVWFVRTYAT